MSLSATRKPRTQFLPVSSSSASQARSSLHLSLGLLSLTRPGVSDQVCRDWHCGLAMLVSRHVVATCYSARASVRTAVRYESSDCVPRGAHAGAKTWPLRGWTVLILHTNPPGNGYPWRYYRLRNEPHPFLTPQTMTGGLVTFCCAWSASGHDKADDQREALTLTAHAKKDGWINWYRGT